MKKFNKVEKSILHGLEQALAYSKGNKKMSTTHKIKIPDIDVKKARSKLGLSQDKFAAAFGVSAATIRNWEQGRREPKGAALVLLNVIAHNPEAVLRSIHH
ncbi:MAG: helix-turn-helix domain-containing protein [Pseudomonadota bacterium]